jgi:hypothetical protein
MKRFLLIILYIIAISQPTKAQFIKNSKAFVEAGAYLSTSGQNPFWIRSNQYGIVPLESQILQIRTGYRTEYDSTRNSESNKLQKKFDYAFGGEVVGNVGKANQFLIPEAYFKTRLRAFEFYVGRRREIVGLVDTTLTSGSYIWSGNALPMPKLQISIPNYTSIIGKGLISIKGSFAHGWFENSRPYTKFVKLHQKWFYGRLGRPNWKINFYGGFNHQAQWGGESPYYSVDGKLPDGLKNFKYVVTGKRGAIKNPNTFDFDANRVGNHLGTVDISMSVRFKNANIFIYRQNLYEDGSLFYLNNIADGLNGISININDKILQKINFEYLNTSNQGGQYFVFGEGSVNELRGGDSYFNNGQYVDGWSYMTKGIGTPFIIPTVDITNEPLSFFSFYTRVKAYSLSTICRFGETNLILRYSHSKNWGTYTEPISSYQNSLLASLNKNNLFNKKYNGTFTLSFDSSNLIKNSFGGGIKIYRIIN